jgi:hypothetical protein
MSLDVAPPVLKAMKLHNWSGLQEACAGASTVVEMMLGKAISKVCSPVWMAVAVAGSCKSTPPGNGHCWLSENSTSSVMGLPAC